MVSKLTSALSTVALAAILLPSLFAAAPAEQSTLPPIDLYFSDWRDAGVRQMRGALEVRDIFTPGDALNPVRKAAVLRFINSYAYATLPAGLVTQAVRLDRQQEIYYVASGKGVLSAGGQNADLYPNVAILVPASLEFSIRNTGTAPLAMYLINEPVPDGFRPNTSILVRDENRIAISSTDGMWSHIVKPLFTVQDGLATLQSVLTVTLDPLTIGRPHPAPGEDTSGIEEVWTELAGSSLAMVGNQLRRQTTGMSYLHIPDNKRPHTNLNTNQDEQVKFLYFARYAPHETRK